MKDTNPLLALLGGILIGLMFSYFVEAKPNHDKEWQLSQEYINLYLKSNNEFLQAYRNHVSQDSLKLITQKGDLYFEFYQKVRP